MKYKTAFRLALRLIGILLIAQSIPNLLVSCSSLALRTLTDGLFWSQYPPLFWQIESGATSLAAVLAGL
jgi:hypothetical protein